MTKKELKHEDKQQTWFLPFLVGNNPQFSNTSSLFLPIHFAKGNWEKLLKSDLLSTWNENEHIYMKVFLPLDFWKDYIKILNKSAVVFSNCL